MMGFILKALLLASSATAASLDGAPKMNQLMQTKAKAQWGCGSCQNVPDGKFLSFRADPNDKSKGFILNSTPNYFMTSTSGQLDDSIELRDISSAKSEGKDDGSNFISLENDIPIPDASTTGLRGNGTNYDELSVWIFGAYRLSETSQPDADPNEMIGFEHNEDYFQGTNGATDCTYKSIGVRYSKDLGKSWTRSVPIVTTGKETEECDDSHRFTGGGDFAPAWNHKKGEWAIFSPETKGLGLKISKEPMAKPGTWTRVMADSGATSPGFIGTGNEDDDASVPALNNNPGANPSIIFDKANDVFHMVWGHWGDGIAYSKSPDLYTWEPSTYIVPPKSGEYPASKYPTLIGDEGDTLTTDGTAQLYFGADNKVGEGRALWQVTVNFGGSGTGAGNATNASTGTALGDTATNNTATTAQTAPSSDTSGAPLSSTSGNTSGGVPVAAGSVVQPSDTEKKRRNRQGRRRRPSSTS
ncbi:uncharacterized protein KY384_007321 [Bacidia gigantensis]|uniref:uncharacterized protein n=1 Tax=Bacidia gigantensis TaxID=2732470 RepID=UPI001D0510AD|nr:uncharacterized protein KY384_007321 [Bacidia gigantensis]KAG8528403.1 hypothetical protein KY384_007321 [Bacidia gigantensis]